MNLLEFLDRIGERRAQRIQHHRDIRQFIGFAFLLGYYVMVWHFSRRALPPENLDLIRDAMLTLGPPVGLIVGAMFRSDAKDEQAARNTGEAFKAVKAAAQAGGGSDGSAIHSGDEVQIQKPRTDEPPAAPTEDLPEYAR